MEELNKINGDIVEVNTADKKLVYLESFKEIILKNPGLIKTFLEFEKYIVQAEESGSNVDFSKETLESGSIRMSLVFKPHGLSVDSRSSYFKVETNDGIFFVKTVPGFYGKGLGADELRSLSRAKELLKGVPNVDVVDFQLGYQDKRGTTYFVSKWQGGFILESYLDRLAGGNDNPIFDRLSKTADKIKSVLSKDFSDVNRYNILYDPETDRFLIFDVHHHSSLV